MKKFFIPALAVALLASCTTTQTISKTEYHKQQARIIEPKFQAFMTPLVGDVEVMKEKGRITSEEYIRPINFAASNYEFQIEEAKKYVLFAETKKHNADILIAATYDINTDDVRKGIVSIRVSGYPAKYVNWRPASTDDYKWINTTYKQEPTPNAVQQPTSANAPRTATWTGKIVNAQ
ncbi:MAG: lipoprotein [Clostridium sp.]|nr:lipoprotein [Clostridium sp.]